MTLLPFSDHSNPTMRCYDLIPSVSPAETAAATPRPKGRTEGSPRDVDLLPAARDDATPDAGAQQGTDDHVAREVPSEDEARSADQRGESVGETRHPRLVAIQLGEHG